MKTAAKKAAVFWTCAGNPGSAQEILEKELGEMNTWEGDHTLRINWNLLENSAIPSCQRYKFILLFSINATLQHACMRDVRHGLSMLERKINLLCKFRNYVTKEEIEGENFKDIIVVKRGEEGEVLIRIVYETRLASGAVGVESLRKMEKKIPAEGYERGILIGAKVSASARREARSKGIEAIPGDKIPAFNIFDHKLVPKHEILLKEEADKLLQRYHVEPYQLPRIRSSDPAVFLIGAKRGDIVKITRESPTAGLHVTYRYVV